MEVGVHIEAENLTTGERKHVATAYLIFVALDERCRPVPVPPVIPERENEKVALPQGELRYRQREENARARASAALLAGDSVTRSRARGVAALRRCCSLGIVGLVDGRHFLSAPHGAAAHDRRLSHAHRRRGALAGARAARGEAPPLSHRVDDVISRIVSGDAASRRSHLVGDQPSLHVGLERRAVRQHGPDLRRRVRRDCSSASGRTRGRSPASRSASRGTVDRRRRGRAAFGPRAHRRRARAVAPPLPKPGTC